jgi:hypothetical protein
MRAWRRFLHCRRSLVATVIERHSHHTAFHSTTGTRCTYSRDTGTPFVPFQRRHVHQTYTVPQSAMKLHLAGQRQAQHATGQEPRPDTTPFTSLACAVFRPQTERRYAKRDEAPYCLQKQSCFVRPPAHNQPRQ